MRFHLLSTLCALWALPYCAFAQLTFGPQQLISDESGVVNVYAEDLDNDGDLDLLSTATIAGIRWWENDGDGNFLEAQYLQQTGIIPLCKAAAIEDYDEDGDLDVMAIINTETATAPTSIQFFTNMGGGVFSNGFIVGYCGPNAEEIISADLDGDGDSDVIFAEGSDDEIGWIENGGGSWNSPIVLTTLADGAQSIDCTDIDQDGDIDIMAAGQYDDQWVWFPNDGNENFPTEIIIGSGDNVSSIVLADLDGDGVEDGLAVYAIDGDVVWSPNLNDGSGYGTFEFLLDGPGFPENFPITVEAFDMDQDGDLDPIHCSILDNTISWFENIGGGSIGPQQIIITGANNVRQTACGDFDGDGDIDIASANFGASQLVWYENTSPIVLDGCTDSTACNYDPDATSDDGSCDFSCLGCTDPGACNYEIDATIDNGSCDYVDAFLLTWDGPTTFCIGDGESDIVEPGVIGNGVSGDNQAFVVVNEAGIILLAQGSFFVDAESLSAGMYEIYSVNYQDGTTGVMAGQLFSNISGCFDISDPIVISIEVGGCTDMLACNFDPNATCSIDLCNYDCLGCTDPLACNFDPSASIDDGSCDLLSCYGCTDPASCNFNVNATNDDGSCEYCECQGCTDPTACNYNAAFTIDDGSCYFAPNGFDCAGVCIDDDLDGICDFLTVPGCNDPFALNFQVQATENDGSCIYPGAICGAGTIWDDQLGQCIAIGETNCQADFNGDSVVNTEDLLFFLGYFGNACPE